MRLRFGRNLNSLTAYNRINRIYKIMVRNLVANCADLAVIKDNPQIT